MSDEQKRPEKLYFVWQENDNFFQQYDNLADAVDDDINWGSDVYVATLKKLGKYKKKVSYVKLKSKKKKVSK